MILLCDTFPNCCLLYNKPNIYYPHTLAGKAVKAFDCSESYGQIERFGEYNPRSPIESALIMVDKYITKKSDRAVQRLAYNIATDMWGRRSSDDMVFMINVLVNTFIKPIKSVQSVTNTESTGLTQLTCMTGNCGNEMINCFKDPTCRAALDCLNSCRGNDQVCQYRCITSHETPAFEKFAQCIIQKHNCMGNSAAIPMVPNPEPMMLFRGKPLTADIADEIFIGHLKDKPAEQDLESGLRVDLGVISDQEYSWKVVCGQNPAYDYFSCQHQIFYKDKKGKMWYDPVFKVTTFAGQDVWRRRHYRVRRASKPGQFHFSVLDNGVVSAEYWRILACADDLSWTVFYYSGAASAAGTNYRGALLCTKDGRWPDFTPEVKQKVREALERGGIKLWELYEVSNADCSATCAAGKAPLGIEK